MAAEFRRGLPNERRQGAGPQGRRQRPGPVRSMAAAAGPDEADEAVRGTCEDASVCKRYRRQDSGRAGPGGARRCPFVRPTAPRRGRAVGGRCSSGSRGAAPSSPGAGALCVGLVGFVWRVFLWESIVELVSSVKAE